MQAGDPLRYFKLCILEVNFASRETGVSFEWEFNLYLSFISSLILGVIYDLAELNIASARNAVARPHENAAILVILVRCGNFILKTFNYYTTTLN